MRSPSSFKLNLMVPWEAGCDGPIWSSMISSDGSDGTIFSFQRAGSAMALSRRASARGADRVHDRIDLRNDGLTFVVQVVLTQRMALERIVHQDAAQIGMALEYDSEHVEAFALEPVSRAPVPDHATHPRVGGVHANFDPEAMAEGERIQMIDDLKPGLAIEPINRGQIGQEIELEAG